SAHGGGRLQRAGSARSQSAQPHPASDRRFSAQHRNAAEYEPDPGHRSGGRAAARPTYQGSAAQDAGLRRSPDRRTRRGRRIRQGDPDARHRRIRRTRERSTMNDGTPVRPARNVELGASGEEFQNLHEFVRKARTRLNQNAWDYIVGAAETETTMRRNRMALDEIAFRPRVLRNVARVDASVQAFGRKMRLPVVIAPVGALEIFDPGSAAAVARGAGRFGAAHMLSSVSEPGLQKTAQAAPDALRFYQLYVRGDDAFVEDVVGRTVANGYAAFCL